MRLFNYTILFLSIFTILSCKKKKEETDCSSNAEFNRKEMVSNLTTQYIIPAYDDYLIQTENLKSKTAVFTQTPSIESLKEARSAWELTASAWQNIAFLEFGPAANIGLRSQTNTYPIDTIKVNNNITAGNTNLALPSNYDTKGIQGLDYLMFSINSTDSNIVSYYTNNNNASEYLNSISSELRNNAEIVNTHWLQYSQEFINNTANNSQGSAVSSIVNSLTAHYETFVRKGKVGLPVGIFNGFSQTPMPGHVEGLYSQKSFALLIAQIEAIQNFINGKSFSTKNEGLGLSNYMDFVDAKKGDESLSIAINTQIDLILSNIKSLNTEPLSSAVINQAEASKALYQNMQKLVPLIKVDLTSALGVLISYQDNDGD